LGSSAISTTTLAASSSVRSATMWTRSHELAELLGDPGALAEPDAAAPDDRAARGGTPARGDRRPVRCEPRHAHTDRAPHPPLDSHAVTNAGSLVLAYPKPCQATVDVRLKHYNVAAKQKSALGLSVLS